MKSSGGEDSGKENNKSDSQPRMEMVLRKNKVCKRGIRICYVQHHYIPYLMMIWLYFFYIR